MPSGQRGVGGILVGGQSSRMGGRPKGLLTTSSGETLVARWRRMFDALDLETVLVGRSDAYTDLGLTFVEDSPPGIGPLGGLVALLAHAGAQTVIAVACDMPHVSLGLLERLLTYREAPVVAPQRGARWEPLFARYSGPLPLAVAMRRVSRQEHRLQGLLDELHAAPLPVTEEEWEELRDWDSPDDMESAPKTLTPDRSG